MVGLGDRVFHKFQTACRYQILEKINAKVLKEIKKNSHYYMTYHSFFKSPLAKDSEWWS